MYPEQREMQQSSSSPDEMQINPNSNPSEMAKDAVDVQLSSSPIRNKTHAMKLRSAPALSFSDLCLQSPTPKTQLDLSLKPRPGKSPLLRGSDKHAGQSSQADVKDAVSVASEDPSSGPCRKRKKTENQSQKTTDPVPSCLGDPGLDLDPSSISCQCTDYLLESTPKTITTRGPKQNCTPDSDNDLLALPLSPEQLKPEEPQSSSPFSTPKVASPCRFGQRQKSPTVLKPRQGRNCLAQESCLASSKASSTLGKLSLHESQLSSDLSIELSLPEEELINISLEEDEEEEEEEEEEDEELPSFLLQISKKPACIKEGEFVWCKFRTFPFWPAVVKCINHKMRKASIVWIDRPTIDKKRKGSYVPLRSLKPFDCDEANQLVCAAKADYEAVIDWSLDFINDYIFRIACSSFTGSFMEYWTHIMSYPVRRKYPQVVSEGLSLPSVQQMEEDNLNSGVEESFAEPTEEEGGPGSKRLLPDRSVAAHNRANEKLVHFIVSQRMVDQRLMAVIRGQQPSKWLRSFLKATRRLQVKNYLEDDRQLDQVYNYLKELFDGVTDHGPCLTNVRFMDDVRFTMDVLLPEAIIAAIAGVDNISITKAEEKYLSGRCISDREREEFEWAIQQQMKKHSVS